MTLRIVVRLAVGFIDIARHLRSREGLALDAVSRPLKDAIQVVAFVCQVVAFVCQVVAYAAQACK